MNNCIPWVAGLFEGEGYIRRVGSRHRRFQAELSLGMCDADIIYRLNDIFPGQLRTKSGRKPHQPPIIEWCVTGQSRVRHILSILLPHFGYRRAYDASNVLDYIDGCYSTQA